MRLPKYPHVTRSGKRIEEGDFWFFHRPTSKYFGAYPMGYEKRLLKYYGGNLIIHSCCGTSKIGVGVDINREVKPTVIADAQHLPFRDNIADSVWIDPPYNEEYSKRYNCSYPSMFKILNEAVRVCKPDKFICFLHLVFPFTPKGTETETKIAVGIGPSKRLRVLSIFRKHRTLEEFM